MQQILLFSLASLLFSFCMIEYQVAFVIIKIYPGSMLMISVYTICENLSIILLLPTFSSFIQNQIPGLVNKSMLTIILKNVFIFFSLGLLIKADVNEMRNDQQIYLQIFSISFSGIFMNINKVLIEKYQFKMWINMDEKNNQEIKKYNSYFLLIKQCAKLLSPLLVTNIINLELSIFAQYMFIIQIVLFIIQVISQFLGVQYLSNHLNENEEIKDKEQQKPKQSNYNIQSFIIDPLFLKMLSMSLLYCTLLDFNQQSLAYLYEHPALNNALWLYLISIFKGLSAITSAIGVFIQNQFHISPYRMGIVGLLQFIISLTPILVLATLILLSSTEKQIQQFSMSTMVCMTLSRSGLWIFDASVQQIIIENVDEYDMNVFNGYTQSLNNMLFLIMNLSTLIFNKTKQFVVFSIISVVNLIISLLLFSITNSNKKLSQKIEIGMINNKDDN